MNPTLNILATDTAFNVNITLIDFDFCDSYACSLKVRLHKQRNEYNILSGGIDSSSAHHFGASPMVATDFPTVIKTEQQPQQRQIPIQQQFIKFSPSSASDEPGLYSVSQIGPV